MADSVFARIIAYICAFFLALFNTTPSELPLVAPKGTSRAAESSGPVIEKEQFLRHPSISSKRKGRQKVLINEETRNKRYGIFSLGLSMQYLSSLVHQPRSESAAVPVVIITPSSPTRAANRPLPPSSSSSLDLCADAAATAESNPSISEDIGDLSLTQDLVPTDIESDIEFDSWTISALQEEAPESSSSFFLPESLQNITFEPIHRASHALSAVSDILYEVPAWNSGEALVPSYFTSTPPKRRRSTGKILRDIENNYVEAVDPPTHNDDDFYKYVDLIPYPDVFDFDMYYHTTTTPLRKKLKKLNHRNCTIDDAFSLQCDGLGDLSPLSDRLPSDDCKRMATTLSLLKITTLQPQLDRIPQHDSCLNPTEPTNTSFKTSATTSSSTIYSMPSKSLAPSPKSQRQFCVLPTSAAHDHTESSPQRPQTSAYSGFESDDAGSMDALYARLREVCDTSVSMHSKGVEIWEPVSF